MRTTWHLRFRKLHRYLGLLLGIQFLMWASGGLYFSWSNMDEIHGDHHRKPAPPLRTEQITDPQHALTEMRRQHPEMVVLALQLIDVLGQPVYQIVYRHAAGSPSATRVQLADATNGKLRPPLTRQEAVDLARHRFAGEVKETVPESVVYLTTVDHQHEYRENPLPAYAIRFNHPSRTTVYVASELGTVQKFRNEKWRIFDFLWMLHTMDYSTRDNFGNILLRAFSIFGLLTILSGFTLFYASSPTMSKFKRKWRRRVRVSGKRAY